MGQCRDGNRTRFCLVKPIIFRDEGSREAALQLVPNNKEHVVPKYKMIFAAVALTLASSVASAAVVSTLSFTTPSGTVGPTDTIDIWVTLTLDPSSDPLTFDRNQADGNLPASLLPIDATWGEYKVGEFASYDAVHTYFSYICSGNLLTSSCDGGEYTSIWFDNPYSWGRDGSLVLQPGESRDFLLRRFSPTDGSAALGEYTLGGIELGFYVTGEDAEGRWLSQHVSLGNTCASGDSSCLFTRTVSEVPLPAGIWLFGSALMGLAGVRHRRVTGA